MKDKHTLATEINFIGETIAELQLRKIEKISQLDQAMADQYEVSLEEYHAMCKQTDKLVSKSWPVSEDFEI